MRTSIKLIVIALAVLILSMAIYDQQMYGAFQKGTYKIPFSNYVASNYTGFRHINLKSASTVNIKIEKGAFRVLTDPTANQFVHLTMNGDTLEIETIFPNEYHGYGVDFGMYIACPELSSIRSNAYYHIRSHQYLDRQAVDYFKFRRTIIQGFTQDSLNIVATNASNIWLVNDTIKNLRALISVDSASASNFYIGERNHFVNTNVELRNLGRFWIDDADSTQFFHYKISDSAQLIISGRANHIIKKLQ